MMSTLVGQPRGGRIAPPLTDLPASGARTVLIAAFDAARTAARIAHMLPRGRRQCVTLDAMRLPEAMLSNRARYLDKLNFATNFAFFRDADGLSTRLVSANYWASYGGGGSAPLADGCLPQDGAPLATLGGGRCPPGLAVSRSTAARCGNASDLPPFTGQLFIHAIGVAGHDVVKYALDTYASRQRRRLSCTHDANAWPSDRFAGSARAARR